MADRDLDTDDLIGRLFYSHVEGQWGSSPIIGNINELQDRGLDSMKKIPWYPWYLDDYMSSEKVELLSMEEEGIYRRLLDRAWHRQGTLLPLDVDILCRLCKNSPAERVQKVLDNFFVKTQEGYLNKRLRSEREKAERIFESRREGANKRWGKSNTSGKQNTSAHAEHDAKHHSEDAAKHVAQHSESISQPQPQPQPQESNTNTVRRFETFWGSYPSRNGKKLEKAETFRRFSKLSDSDQELCAISSRHFADSSGVKKGIGVRDPKRFIRDGNGNEPWRDWIEPEVKNAGGNGKDSGTAGKNHQHSQGPGLKPQPGEYDRKPKYTAE